MNVSNRKLPQVDKFKKFPSMPVLGLGTIWIGRRWPVDYKNYQSPSQEEIFSHLDLAYGSGIRMFDTAAAYGYSEEMIGKWFKLSAAKKGTFGFLILLRSGSIYQMTQL